MVEGGAMKVVTWEDIQADAFCLSVPDFHCRVRFPFDLWRYVVLSRCDVGLLVRHLQGEIENRDSP